MCITAVTVTVLVTIGIMVWWAWQHIYVQSNDDADYLFILWRKELYIIGESLYDKARMIENPKLTTEQRQLIGKHTGGSQYINESLRYECDLNEEKQKRVEALDEAISGHARKDILLYRYVNRLPSDIMTDKNLHKYCIDKGYMEASLTRHNGHERKKIMLILTVPKGTNCIYVPEYTKAHSEEEGVLFPRNVKIIIKKRIKRGLVYEKEIIWGYLEE